MFLSRAIHLNQKKHLNYSEELQIKGVHMAIVFGEHGGTAVIIPMEDLLEEIVGDIHDSHNPDEKRIRKNTYSSYLIKVYTYITQTSQINFTHKAWLTITSCTEKS